MATTAKKQTTEPGNDGMAVLARNGKKKPLNKEQLANLIDALTNDEDVFETIEAGIEYEGTVIKLPALPRHMLIEEAIKWLQRLNEEENKEVGVQAMISCFPYDGAVAFSKALRQIYGWSSPVPTPGFWGPEPPTAVTVKTGPHSSEQVFWGSFQVPNVEGRLQTSADWLGMQLIIAGTIKQRHIKAVQEIIELTQKIVQEASIYRGQAFRLIMDKKGNFDRSKEPRYFDTATIRPEEMVFSEELMEQVETNLFTPIIHTDICRQNQIPLKRSILMEGPFGTGKTLCAAVCSKLCVEHGWTFITVERVTALRDSLQLAQMYQPAVVFVEDIDRGMEGEARTPQMDDILNVVDGVITKGMEIMLVVTSNRAEAINKAMLRPGRLDAVLHIDAPDADAAEKLMRIYGRGRIPAGAPLTEAKKLLAGKIPAVIRECVERSKLYAIARGDATMTLTDVDVVRASKGMQRHLQLLEGKKEAEPTPEHALGAALVKLLNASLVNGTDTGFSGEFKDLTERVEAMHKAMGI